MLQAWRVGSKPSRVYAWASETATYSGPASTPYPSRLLVTRSASAGVAHEVVAVMSISFEVPFGSVTPSSNGVRRFRHMD